MTPARRKAAEQGLNSAARKVLAAVPKGEAWPRHKIAAELARMGGNYPADHIDGCLGQLRDAGLVRSPVTGHWVQVPVRVPARGDSKGKVAPLRAAAPEPEPPVKKEEPAGDDLGMELLELAESVRAARANLAMLAEKIERAATRISEQSAARDEELSRLRELKSLLRSLGN